MQPPAFTPYVPLPSSSGGCQLGSACTMEPFIDVVKISLCFSLEKSPGLGMSRVLPSANHSG